MRKEAHIFPSEKEYTILVSRKFGLITGILALLLCASTALNVYQWYKAWEQYRVVKITDGDTYILKNHMIVRLGGANAPEIDACLGKESATALENLILGKVVRLTMVKNDNYNRIKARTWVGNLSVDVEMIRSGMARIEYTSEEDGKDLHRANDAAKMERVGVFGDACSVYPGEEATENCQVKANIDDNTQKKYYHLPGCQHYDEVVISKDTGDKCFMTEKEAIDAGFAKAAGCK